MKKLTRIIMLGVLFTLSSVGWARDMHARLGLGYNAQFANHAVTGGVPGLSLKYGLTRDIAFAGVFGAATSSPSNFVSALKLFKNFFYETNLNFYFMLGGGLVAGAGNTGAQFITGFGAEFFIPGLESLGFSFETGGSLDNLGGTFVLKTLGVSFLNAGLHFYF